HGVSSRAYTHKLTTLTDVRLAPHKRRRSGHFLTAASCQEPTNALQTTNSVCVLALCTRDKNFRYHWRPELRTRALAGLMKGSLGLEFQPFTTPRPTIHTGH